MTRSEQERLVGRYLNGELSATEEQEFFILVAVDNELRQTLKAFRIVDTAIQKHRESAPIQHSDTRNNLLIALNLQAAGSRYNGHRGPTQGPNVQSRRRLRDTIVSPMLFKWMMAAATACSLAIGTFVIAPFIANPTEEIAQNSGTARIGSPHRGLDDPLGRQLTATLEQDAPIQEERSDVSTRANQIGEVSLRSERAVETTPAESISPVGRQVVTDRPHTSRQAQTSTEDVAAQPKNESTTPSIATDNVTVPQVASQERPSALLGDSASEENDGTTISNHRSSPIKLTTPDADTLKFKVSIDLKKLP